MVKLTDAVQNDAELLLSRRAVSASQGLSITFDFYSYGGTGADGISFFLVDGSKDPTEPGGFGGSLGYAQGSKGTGLAGGYLAVGFDEFGNFSDPKDFRTGGPGFTPDAVVVRGSEATGYNYLDGTGTLSSGLDVPGPNAVRAEAKRHVKIDITATGNLTIAVDLNNNGLFEADGSETLIKGLELAPVNGNLPATVKLGFAGSTGTLTNIHEVENIEVKTSAGTPITGLFSDVTVIGGDGGSGNDIVGGGGTGSNNNLSGNAGNDILLSGPGADVLTGGPGADRFVFSGPTKAAALKTSRIKNLDRITDFRFNEGDRFQLDFDSNLNSIELPKKLFNSGRHKGNLKKAAAAAYADKDQRKKGDQALKADEAVFFRVGSKTYLSVNDGKSSFNPKKDLVADVTGIEFRSGDAQLGRLAVTNYFA